MKAWRFLADLLGNRNLLQLVQKVIGGFGFVLCVFVAFELACEQALRGALVAGREKEGELATRSLEFEYLHRKSRCEMLIGGDDISNDVITLKRVFRCLFTFELVSPSR